MTPDDDDHPDEQELRDLDDSLRLMGRELDEALQGDMVRCGRYTLLSEIGEGGYGEVHLAVQDPPAERRVAIKILKRGLDTREIIRRFSLEQRALARIDHPNVASILDAGTTADGRPWFAMPLLDGDPITLACDDARLGLEERVSILAAACDGVQAAHAQGIVHRDLKPSNIIVVRDGAGRTVPKVIDFGIAKALDMDEGTTRTADVGRLGTPAYMAPEQLRPANPWTDIRSDVFALGTILHELLTGVQQGEPLVGSGSQARLASRRVADAARADSGRMRDAANARGFPTSAALGRRLRGDLEAIVSKATAPDLVDRYQSVDSLSSDLRRWVEREPISARAPGMLFLARAFTRRHFATVAIGCSAIVLVVGIAIVALVQSARAREQSQRAAAAAGRADEVSSGLKDLLSGLYAAAAGGGDRRLIIELLDAAATRHARACERLDAISASEISAVLGDAFVSVDLPERALELADNALRAIDASGEPGDLARSAEVSIAKGRLLTLRGDAIASKMVARDGFLQLFSPDESAYEAWTQALALFDQAAASSSRAAIRCKIRFWSSDRTTPFGEDPAALKAALLRDVELLDDRDPLKWMFHLRRAEMNDYVGILRDYPAEIGRARAALGDRHLLVFRARLRVIALQLAATVESVTNPKQGVPAYDDSQRRAIWQATVADGARLTEEIQSALGADHPLAVASRFWAGCALGYLAGPEAARPSFEALRADVIRLHGPKCNAIGQLDAAWRGVVEGPKSGRWW
jgi:hypothetical protein